MIQLNLGCGDKYLQGYRNIDHSMIVLADDYYDVLEGIREHDGAVEKIIADNLLEHISDGFIEFMNECWRVLREGGTFEVYVPDATLDLAQAIGDPTHFPGRLFCQHSFRYFDCFDNLWKEYGRTYGIKPWRKQKLETVREIQVHCVLEKVNDA